MENIKWKNQVNVFCTGILTCIFIVCVCVVFQTVEHERQKVSELMSMCLEKDQRIDTLQEALDNATNEVRDCNVIIEYAALIYSG